MRDWPHVVVVGGGFVTLKVCHRLAGQPLLHQVASGLVAEAANIQIRLGEVVAIDPEARQAELNGQRPELMTG